MPNTSNNDHDLLIRIDERVTDILVAIRAQNGRIRALERWRWVITGAVTVVAVSLGYILKLVSLQ